MLNDFLRDLLWPLFTDTNISSVSTSNQSGVYAVTGLRPGSYRIKVKKDGFNQIDLTDVSLNVQDDISRNFVLRVGSTSESVSVEGNAGSVETSGSVSTVIDRHFVESLPLNGRSFNTLLQLTPGVLIVASNPEMPGQFSSNGQRSSSNYFQVDGVSANFGVAPQHDLFQAGNGGSQAFNTYGGTSSLVSVDAMQEFRVETSSFAAEFGRSPGAQVLITTRSGTNDFHGSVFDYFRNTVFDANDWFANRAKQPRAAEQQNDFGGVFGGPIWRDKTFFFFSYEGLRLLQPQTTVVAVPSASIRASAVPAAASVLNSFPLPNGPVFSGGSTAQFTGNFSSRISMDAASLRIDHSFGSHLDIFGRLNWSPSETVTRVQALSEVQNVPQDTRTITLGANESISGGLYNSIRLNFSRQTAGQSSLLDTFGGAKPIDTGLLLPSPFSLSNGFAALNALDSDQLSLGRASRNIESQFNVLDDFSVIKGTHRWKLGTDYRRLRLETSGFPIDAIYVYFTGSFASSGNTLGTIFRGARPGKIVLPNFSTYLQDTWTMGKRVTLTYGLRWEVNATPSPENGTILSSWQNVNNPQTTLAPIGTPIFNTTYGNLAPRVGLAVRLNKKGDFVIRGGWGIFYDLEYSIAPELINSFPNLANQIFFGVPIPDPNFSSHANSLSFSTQPPFTGPLIIAFDPNLNLPYAHEWNLTIEKLIGNKQSVSASYVAQVGRRLLRQEGVPAPNSNLPQGYILISNAANSNYNALQLQYKRPLYRSVQALLNYTWSHSIDTASDDFSTAISSSIAPVSGDRGSSNFDVRHNFSGTLTYAVPVAGKNGFVRKLTDAWFLATVFNARSGFPIDISTSAFFPAVSRPDLDTTQPIWIPDSTTGPGKKLNPLAFPVPPTERQGTLPRNLIYGLGASQIDLSLQRRFPLTERVHLDFRTDAFNILNHPNFANPVGTVESAQFGTFNRMLNKGLSGLSPLYQIGGPRSLQLSLKLIF